MWKFYNFRQLISKPLLNFRTITILADGSEKNRNKTLCTATSFDLENPNSPVPFRVINKENFKNYQFPIIKLSYDREDVVEHAKTVRVQPGEKHADLYLNKRNTKLQVLPSFPFLFSNKILMDMAEQMPFRQEGLHGEHYIEQFRQLPPEGIINLEIKTLDVLDKGKGTLYCYTVRGFDENGETYFKLEIQTFEVGTGGFNGNKTNPHLSRLAESKSTAPDSILEFPLLVPEGGFKETLSDSDMHMSYYSSLHPHQYFSRHPSITDPVTHGICTFGGAIQLILFKYGSGNVDKFKAAKVRFANPVHPGDNMLISTWKEDSKIIFQGDVKRDGKTITALAGGYVDFDL